MTSVSTDTYDNAFGARLGRTTAIIKTGGQRFMFKPVLDPFIAGVAVYTLPPTVRAHPHGHLTDSSPAIPAAQAGVGAPLGGL